METAGPVNPGNPRPSEAARSGHWLPALRPDSLEESEHNAAITQTESGAFSNGTINIIPPTPQSKRNPRGESLMQEIYRMPVIQDDHSLEQNGRADDTTATKSTWPPRPSDAVPAGDELPSDDDDERLDPAWGIKRQDSAHILDRVRRSTTFPEFFSSGASTPRSETASPSQAPQIETTNGPTEETESTDQGVIPTEPQTAEWIMDGHDTTQQPQSWTIAPQEEPVDEAAQRFEEGVPLIQTEEIEMDVPDPKEAPRDNPFDEAPGDEDATFFSSINTSEEAPEKRTLLDRKSTAQVLDSLTFQDRDTSKVPVAPDAEESSFYDELAATNKPSSTEDEVSKDPAPEDVDAMWAAALEDDEFLVEDPDDLLPDSEPGSPEEKPDNSQTAMPSGAGSQLNHRERQTSINQYAPHQPSTSDMLALSPASPTTHNNVGLSHPGLAPMGTVQDHLQQRPGPPQQMKSFVDQAKDGYKSPYDLPLDISKSRKKHHIPQPIQTARTVAPPPRSSSLYEKPLQSPFNPDGPPTSKSTSGLMYPPAPSPAIRSVSAAVPTKPETPRSVSSGFFEELPVSSRARPAAGQGRYTPQQPTALPPPQLLPQSPALPLPLSPPQTQPSPPRPSDPYAQYQLRAPERLDPYANVPLQPVPPAPAPAAASTRYSPAPAPSTLGPRPGPSARYSPAPPPQAAPAPTNRYASQPQVPPTASPQAAPPTQSKYASQPGPAAPVSTMLPFQPRTSSPLAFHKSYAEETANEAPPSTRQALEDGFPTHQMSAAPSVDSTGLVEPKIRSSPPKRPAAERMPPRRSQTQSPSQQRPQPAYPAFPSHVPNRPASAYGQSSHHVAQLESAPPPRPDVQARGLASELEFVRPQDETQFDPLERWKGAPLFSFGFGGCVVTSFPKHVPRYAAGLTRPQIKSNPGEVSIRNGKDIIPQKELLNSFPGPLRSKSKKKDVLSWMANYLNELESSMPDAVPTQSLPDPGRRHQEKILLWKIVRALVDNDGSLDGPILKAVNLILSPEVHGLDESTASQYRTDAQLSGIYQPSGTNVRPDPVDSMAVETLRKRLLSGDRQSAVFHAMDNRLWSHALVISSTMERSMWSQVVREFVRQEVKTVGENAESLSALYEIFGGNVEESIDQLVPPSARAGLQMISRVDTGGPTKNALDGLNRWKETLSLVLNNRSQGDHQALAALGKLLDDYNRVEAAHICYLFSRSPLRPIIFGGIDEEHPPIVLLGGNHKAQPFDFVRDQESIILTEIYEFATCVLAAGAPTSSMPHLSVYKLHRAVVLADAGLRVEAQSYCDAIAATFKSSTKMSPYHHPLLLSRLDDLTIRLKQTPIQGSSSWMTKPSLEKVSGSMWTKFSSFVAGDESDAESKGSGKDAAEAGPFANVAGTPAISRSASQSELHGPYAHPIPPTVAASRYAPNGMQSARSSAELTRGRPSFDSQRSPTSAAQPQNQRPYDPVNMFQQGQAMQPQNPYQPFATASPPRSLPQSPPRSSYLPNNVAQGTQLNMSPSRLDSQTLSPPSENTIQPSYGYAAEPISDSHPEETAFSYGGYEPPQPDWTQTPAQPEANSEAAYEPPTQSYGYEPPTGNGYVPYVPEPDSPEDDRQEVKSKKKSFMDDDGGDDYTRMSNQPPPFQPEASGGDDEAARRRANDAAAEAAFRAAAEADAAAAQDKEKSHAKKSSGSWFGGWLGGKKSAESLDAAATKGGDQKVYKAKLGESKMKLYYDKDLGKWVNPDNPDAASKAATPPPPRMGGTPAPPMGGSGPPRSGAMPSFPNTGMSSSSRTGTPANGPALSNVPSPLAGISGPPSAAGTPPLGHSSTPGLAPPSRPGTGMSNASSIDDLIGPATGRKTVKGAKKGAKSGRYVDVMAK